MNSALRADPPQMGIPLYGRATRQGEAFGKHGEILWLLPSPSLMCISDPHEVGPASTSAHGADRALGLLDIARLGTVARPDADKCVC